MRRIYRIFVLDPNGSVVMIPRGANILSAEVDESGQLSLDVDGDPNAAHHKIYVRCYAFAEELPEGDAWFLNTVRLGGVVRYVYWWVVSSGPSHPPKVSSHSICYGSSGTDVIGDQLRLNVRSSSGSSYVGVFFDDPEQVALVIKDLEYIRMKLEQDRSWMRGPV